MQVLGLLLYPLYTSDIPAQNDTTFVTFADDTALLSLHKNYNTATSRLQVAYGFNIYIAQNHVYFHSTPPKETIV